MKSSKTSTIILLLAVAGILIITSWRITLISPLSDWQKELSKAFLGLAMTVIFGGLLKFVLDKYQEERKKEEKQREFKSDIVNRLRKVFDAVDNSRLLVEAHKSAKTYGEKMRENIIPSITTLYDIKRSLVDVQKIVGEEPLPLLRISMHYMIAYLVILSEEYKNKYPEISNDQFYQEAVRQKEKEMFLSRFEKENPLLRLDNNTPIPPPSEYTWKKIKGLVYLSDFLSNKIEALYYTIFIEHYEYCKGILRDARSPGEIKKPNSFSEGYTTFLKKPDDTEGEGDIQKSDNLVLRIMNDHLKYREFLKANSLSN